MKPTLKPFLICMTVLSATLLWPVAVPAAAEETVVDVSTLPTAEDWPLKWRNPDQTPTYKTTPQGDLKLHVFLPPEGSDSDTPRGALVLFHGGGWVKGQPKALYWQANYLASRGMVVFSAEYRTEEKHGTTPFECVADAKSAVRYVRANAQKWNIDPHKIAAGGGSAGGHIAACTAVLEGYDDPEDATPEVSSRPDALVLWNPVLDTSKKGFGHKRIGDDPEQLSPLHQAAGDVPPTIIFNGTKDKTAKIETVRAVAERFAELGREPTVVAYEGEEHAFFYKGKGEGRCFVDTLKWAEDFLAEIGYLGVSEPG